MLLEDTLTAEQVEQQQIIGQLFINGQWRDAENGQSTDVINPATGKVIGTVADATLRDVDDAVQAARTAFDSGVWSEKPARERARILFRVADLIRERSDKLALLESLDVGKPLTIATAVDVETAAEEYEQMAALTMQISGDVRETAAPAHAFTQREAVGVVAAITPFNFPLVMSATKLAPALAMGNSVVHKPSPDTPLTALAMVDILQDAGVPDGVVNVVTAAGSDAGEALTTHELVDMIAFTGSTQVGAKIAEQAGRSVKPVNLELGGNGAHLVFADADLDVAVGSIVGGALFNAGQFCMAGTRILVERAVFDTVVERVTAAVNAMTVGVPSAPETEMGPLANVKQLARVEHYIGLAREAGANIITGGERVDLDEGFYYRPTVVTDVGDDHPVVAEEVFGPVLTIQPFDTEDEAIQRANASEYGLAAGIQTGDIRRAHRVSKRIQAGLVWVNTYGLLDPAMPFGGVKKSGYGRERGIEGLEAYTQIKSVVFGL